MTILCKMGIHRWVKERLAELVDHYTLIGIPRTYYAVLMCHCGRCGKLKVKTLGTFKGHYHN
jgi:hypothetical protein